MLSGIEAIFMTLYQNISNGVNSPKISIIIVTWNSLHYIPDCLHSLTQQSYLDFSVLVVDNASNDGTVEFIRQNFPTVSVLQNFKNVGFAKANNQGIKLARGEYVLVMNPDVMLEKNFLKNIMEAAKKHERSGSFGGKMLKLKQKDLDPSEHAGGLQTPVESDVVDSAGLDIYKSRRVVNRGEGQKDTGQFEGEQQVFGISGSCCLYRKKALDDVSINGEYFDQDFNTYKEDADLAWRLRLYGWESWYIPKARGFHHRSYSSKNISTNVKGFFSTVRGRKKVPKTLRMLSVKNHHLMLVKNDMAKIVFKHIIPLTWHEVKLVTYIVIFEPYLWKSFVRFFQQIPAAARKRKIIMSRIKVDSKDMAQWFN